MKHRQKSIDRYGGLFIRLLKRVILAILLFVAGFYLLHQGNLGLLVIGFAPIILGAVIVAFPLAELFAEPTGNLFWPSEHYDRPQPAYSIPQSKRTRGLYEEAMAGFEKIAEEYPQEVQPYVEMIDIAVVNLHDPQRANAIFHRGVSILKKDEDRETLVRMYRAIQTRLNSRTGN
ncbi:MAG: hypothetical protein KJ964_03835 [Verrucomicrobia bacterium]|nr:hypothetical protein [Verrucomicrobiota bacterium]MBU1736370.1 hypothetical protein [Verrucomicrobiota bacterium]MBU1857587.1 hypothetical protein [Verrucomicrobiota bacterium]